ncbi:homogentisate 1,2-dioxygenase [Lactarius hengduanensis]|nr:homogentisate 1,2-dioxygenase [Lactarius hengduanensis]
MKSLSEILRHARGLIRTPSSPVLSFHVRYSHTITARPLYIAASTEKDPYQYQVGFGNRFVSEALPRVLPVAQNSPQRVKYGLYVEAVMAHRGFTPLAANADVRPLLEAEFSLTNPHVQVSPTQLAWHPFAIPHEGSGIDFPRGLKTLCGAGSPVLREGLAIHIYAADKSMENEAFCNNDGHMLILPQQGRLDIQTEFGRMMIRPGELVVIQRGMKFKVELPDGPVRGYIQEIFGSQFDLPELGPLGTHGLANTRDFESPVASFDVDQSPWESTFRLGGRLYSCKQDHTPFDVVAWHGNYVPYKYALEKFVNVGSISKDHIDPSIFCVLTAKSKIPHHSLVDLLIFSPRWDVSNHTFRPPFYHRNSATEFMGLLYGVYGGRSDGFQPGGASYETGFCPHGVSYEEFNRASEADLKPMRVHEGTIAFMFESSLMLPLTDYAIKRSGVLHGESRSHWFERHRAAADMLTFQSMNRRCGMALGAQFMDHLGEINAELRKTGVQGIKAKKT